MAWMVMAGVEWTESNPEGKTAFETNATDLINEKVARIEANRRNAIESMEGRGDSVTWFPMEQLDLRAMMAKMGQ